MEENNNSKTESKIANLRKIKEDLLFHVVDCGFKKGFQNEKDKCK